MKTLFTLLISFALAAAAFAQTTLTGKVVAISDGDTYTLLTSGNVQTKIRMNCIDAPESKQAFGTRSKQKLSELIFGKEVTVTVVTTDKYGRTVGTTFVGTLDVNLELVKTGFAWVYDKYCKDAVYFDAQTSAKAAKLGLWIDPNPVAPSDFRHVPNTGGAATDSEDCPTSGNCGCSKYKKADCNTACCGWVVGDGCKCK